MIAGLILGTLISVLSALLLPVIFPAQKEVTLPYVTAKDLRRAANAVRLVAVKLQRAQRQLEESERAEHRHPVADFASE
jgi:hypothetical protein